MAPADINIGSSTTPSIPASIQVSSPQSTIPCAQEHTSSSTNNGSTPNGELHIVGPDASSVSGAPPAASGTHEVVAPTMPSIPSTYPPPPPGIADCPAAVSNKVIETEILIVGAGPSGASLACFLAEYGLKGIIISAAPGTANTPRAHITNIAALECLRDIGLDAALKQVSSEGSCMMHTRWCHSMAGAEYARIYSWGNDPKRKGDYESASPCAPMDLPQTLLEPVLVRHATHAGYKMRFDTALLGFTRDTTTGMYTATLRDKLANVEYRVCTKYIFGADGAQSQVVKQLDLPLIKKPGQGLAVNVLVRADMSHLVDARRGNLHWVMQPDREHPAFGWMGLVRMVKPWHEWMFILFPSRDVDGADNFESLSKTTNEEYLARVRGFIGDDTPAEILNVSKWYINEIVAETYSVGNVFCLGDAVHRHPPMNGLGSNTCIQDAFNLAWKVAYVHNGLAGPQLLDTYSVERQPVGKGIITRANQGFRDHYNVWEALGALPRTVKDRRAVLDELEAPTPAGQARRNTLRQAIHHTTHEFNGLGIEMNQHYSGQGIYVADESEAWTLPGRAAVDPILYHEPNTYPGSRLPHVWLNHGAIPSAKPTSTIDIAGHGKFVLFTGIGGDAWHGAASRVSEALGGVPLHVHTVGFRQQWEDFYFAWAELRGVGESGAVLVRPDRFVAWRAQEVAGDEAACAAKLATVMRSILGL
ncbi:2,4-dichlorophenol 6-monooxygenase [Sporothrix brasiliensis 5110]|uniref:2,4-dichlorophenol 6-monooxygenase n=1 Tax=Sporothrix brasiliensis 5110 TaxID=1398154 RepID=A0A0C2JC73_9PEZI|nr:2,4-dichlorophenol 6-monooxygenase [Sporothrix brasiliensis 5110]KIH94522.1 2,4-dichlorophenol 6-monooxygenase [Sporothrix brasiliensis 5110]